MIERTLLTTYPANYQSFVLLAFYFLFYAQANAQDAPIRNLIPYEKTRTGIVHDFVVVNESIYAAAENGLFRFSNGRSELIPLPITTSQGGILSSVTVGADETLWLAVYGIGIFVVDTRTHKVTPFNHFTDKLKTSWDIEFCNDKVFINTINNVVALDASQSYAIEFLHQNNSEQPIRSLQCSGEILAFFVADEVVLAQTDNVEVSRRLSLAEVFPQLKEISVVRLLDDVIYVGGDTGFYRYQDNIWQFVGFDEVHSVTKAIQDVYRHIDGTIWVAASGIYRVSNDKLVPLNNLYPLLSLPSVETIKKIAALNDKEVLFSSTQIGVVVLPAETTATRLLGISEKIHQEEIVSAFRIGDDNVLLETHQHVFRVDLKQNGDLYPLPIDADGLVQVGENLFLDSTKCELASHLTGFVENLKEISNRALCFGENYHSLRYGDDKWLVHLQKNRSQLFFVVDEVGRVVDQFPAPKNRTKLILLTSGNELLVVDNFGRLYIQKSKFQWASHVYRSDSAVIVNCAYEYRFNLVSLCTDGHGLINFDLKNATFSNVDVRLTQDSRFVRGGAIDRQGNETLATNKGLIFLNRDRQRFMSLGHRFGVVDSDFDYGAIFKASDDAMIVFGDRLNYLMDMRKLAAIFEDRLNTSTSLIASLRDNQGNITTVSTDGLNSISVPYDSKKLLIEFQRDYAIWDENADIEYRYINDSDRWNLLSDDTDSIEYLALPVGRNVFEIRYKDMVSELPQPVTRFIVDVDKPVWRSLPLMLLYLSILILLFGLVHHRYKRGEARRQLKIKRVVFSQQDNLKESQTSIRSLLDIRQRFFSQLAAQISSPVMAISNLMAIDAIFSDSKESVNGRKNLSLYVEQIKGLVSYFQSYSGIQRNKHLPLKRYILKTELTTVLESLRPQLESKNIELTLINRCRRTADFVPDSLEIIAKALINAALYLAPAGGLLNIKAWEDGLDLRVDTEILANMVPDAEPFEIDDKLKVEFELAKSIAITNDGYLHLSELNSGAAGFQLSLPIVSLKNEDFIPFSSDEVSSIEPVKKSDSEVLKTVLVVEENEALRHLLVSSIQDSVLCFSAASLLDAQNIVLLERPDLIVADFNLSTHSGLDFLAFVRKDEALSDTPFIMTTTVANSEIRQSSITARADLLLEKPFSSEELLLHIQNLLERYKNKVEPPKSNYLTRLSELHAGESIPTFSSDREQAFFLKYLGIIQRHFSDESFNRKQAAGLLYISERQLNRKLNALKVENFAEYLKRFRLNHARKLLSEGKTITDVAFSVGFSTPSYFTSCFKAEFGQTPTQFRDENYRFEQ